jgi:hypothetical protein
VAAQNLTAMDFLTLYLVRSESMDVVATTADFVTREHLQINISRNESHPDDSRQAEELKVSFESFFIDSTAINENTFGEKFSECSLGWGKDKIGARLSMPNKARGTKDCKESSAKRNKLLTLDEVITTIDDFKTQVNVSQVSALIALRYQRTSAFAKSKLWGDSVILAQISDRYAAFDVVRTLLVQIKAEIGVFHQMTRLGSYTGSDFRTISIYCKFWGCRVFSRTYSKNSAILSLPPAINSAEV